ncbi:hypothetical protein [Desulfonatronum sp. SC1]|uniref:hypothetical protein n=1 Tax=Desulfonatronum sp. SC1 TaxID=2109626 RepID=UPI001E58CC81|nr:hypothetical protein [Desulfonatronum sp. SC1]
MRMLEDHPYTAVQILNRIKNEGYVGGYSILKDYVRKVRPKRTKAFLKLNFAPGATGARAGPSGSARPRADSASSSWSCATAE